MRSRVLASRPTDALCALCAFRLYGEPLRSAAPARTFRRAIKTTATGQQQVQLSRQERSDDGVSSGWGAQSVQRDTPSTPGWGSRADTRKADNDTSSWTTEQPSASYRPLQRSGDSRREQSEPPSKPRLRIVKKFAKADNNADFPLKRSYNFTRVKTASTGKERDDGRDASTSRASNYPPERLARQTAPKWRHLQFKQDRPSGADKSATRSERWTREQDERFENAKRGERVTWGPAQGLEWDVEPPKQPDSQPDRRAKQEQEKQRSAERRAARFRDTARDSGREAAADSLNTEVRDRNRKSKPAKNRASRRDEDEDEDIDDQVMDRVEQRQQRKALRKAKREAAGAPTPIFLPDFISIGNLATALKVRTEDFHMKLQEMGFEDFTNDHVIGNDDAGLIAQEYNFEPTTAPAENAFEDLVAAPEPAAEEKELLLARPPVVTIMGHVDHGKTTLLDFFRQSSVAAGEHGGITQHIGAFIVNMSTGRTITFLDTPGHAAFLDMRARGANVTDIVILVVAADDSVKPQTLEAIKHAQAAAVPMIVAITKVDKEGADIDRVKRDLAQHGVQVEDFGGDVQAIPVSGKTGEGMADLEEAAVTLADILDIRADVGGRTEGWILESSLKRHGKVATVLVRRGTMKPGDIIVAGNTWAKIRNLRNEAGQIVPEASPGQPVEIDGWDESPDAGAEVIQAPSLQKAKDVTEYRRELTEAQKLAEDVEAANEQRIEAKQQAALAKEQSQLDELQKSDPQRAAELQQALDLARDNEDSSFINVPLIVRADVAGSVEALSAAILAIGNSEIRSQILRADVGQVSESDVELASTARGAIVNFGAGIDNAMWRMAETEDVPIIDGNVIYRVTDAVRELLERRLPKKYTPKVLGEADIAQIFDYTIKGRGKVPVAGCKVQSGMLERAKSFKVIRSGQVVHEGPLAALKIHKKDVAEVRRGSDCGLSFDDFAGYEVGDRVQCFELVEEKRSL